jgi:hypothetical protein
VLRCRAHVFLCHAAAEQTPAPVTSVNLLGLSRHSPKKPHVGAPSASPARLRLSPPAPVDSVDLLGLDRLSPKKANTSAPPASPARLQLSSPSLVRILKPGCTVREVEWKDLAIQKHVGTGSRCVTSYRTMHGYTITQLCCYCFQLPSLQGKLARSRSCGEVVRPLHLFSSFGTLQHSTGGFECSFTGIDRSAVEREFANEVDMMQLLGPNPSLVLLLAVCAEPLSIVLEYLPFSLLYVPSKLRLASR